MPSDARGRILKTSQWEEIAVENLKRATGRIIAASRHESPDKCGRRICAKVFHVFCGSSVLFDQFGSVRPSRFRQCGREFESARGCTAGAEFAHAPHR